MTIGITCSECDKEVIFWLDGEEKRPQETCDCGQTYELRVNKVSPQ